MGKVKSKILYHGTHISVGVLALLMFALAFPMVSENSYANIVTLADNEAALLTTNIDVTPTIALAVKEQLDFEILPHSSGSAFNKGATTLVVNTNTDAGYNLYIHTTSEGGKLHNTREGITDTLNPMAAGVKATSESMAVNTWGYSSDGTNYQAVPTTSTKIPGTEGATTSKTYTISIGAKIDLNIAAGKYQGNVIFSTVANPIIIEKIGWDTIKTMQEMTPEICASAPVWKSVADTRVLLDDRGGMPRKSYNVAKLKDNNCWMQENLAINLGFEMTGSDTDLAPNAKKTLPATTTAARLSSNNNNGLESSHPNGYWYYQWATATAGSGTTTAITADYQEAPDSICPKGWQLPLAGSRNNNITTSGNPTNKTGSGSFSDLLISYGLTSINATVMAGAPLYFIRAGYFDTNGPSDGGGGAYVGNTGYYWSRVAQSSTGAYLIGWNSSGGAFADYSTRYNGATLRCVARQKLR